MDDCEKLKNLINVFSDQNQHPNQHSPNRHLNRPEYIKGDFWKCNVGDQIPTDKNLLVREIMCNRYPRSIINLIIMTPGDGKYIYEPKCW